MKNKTNNVGKTFIGQVKSNKMSDTIVVSLEYTSRHPKYQKIITKNKNIYSSNNLSAQIGDTVEVRETRPISKLKRFTTIKIIKKASPTL
jgi:small subunit ribosomal protein S17